MEVGLFEITDDVYHVFIPRSDAMEWSEMYYWYRETFQTGRKPNITAVQENGKPFWRAVFNSYADAYLFFTRWS